MILGTKLCYIGDEAMLCWGRSCVILGTKLRYVGDEAMLCWGRSYVFEGSKLCYLCCNAIAKDLSLSRE